MNRLGVLVLCLVQLSSGFVLEETFEDTFRWLTRSRKSVIPPLEAPECTVSQIKSVSRFEPQKFAGEWFEAYRTATSSPFLYSGTWKFQATKIPGELSFMFSAKMQNQQCLGPVVGTAIASSLNPGTITLSYDGLKGAIEEEYKLLEVDYNSKAVLYGCRHLLESGHCHPNASFLVVLVKYRRFGAGVQENLRKVAKQACIEPVSLLQQDMEKACNWDHLDSPPWKTQDWPTCRAVSVCTLACPPCCKEDEDGCIYCDCQTEESHTMDKYPEKDDMAPDHEEVEECVTSLSSCSGAKCKLRESKMGCFVCDCSTLLAAPPMGPPVEAAPAFVPDIQVHNINDERGCPTNCRIVKEKEQMKCNCSNKDMCEPIPPRVPYSCSSPEERWYFDPRTMTCHGFFGSCLPETNNFRTLKECINTCADVCELPPLPGMCQDGSNKHLTRYYHNRVRGECDSFIYSGCGGNENNYKDKKICEHRCPGHLQPDSHLTIKEICTLPSDKGTCTSEEKTQIKYFYLPATKTCTTFFFSGCGGNENKFESEEACKKICTGDTHATSCIAVSNCPCETQVNEENECPFCPCPDSSSALQLSLIILVASSASWLATWLR